MDLKDSLVPIWNNASKDYKLLEILGKGSFGIVVRARHRYTQQMVAIKLIDKISNTPYQMRQILREIFLLRKLTQIENNLFTVKLLDIILPKEVLITAEEESKYNLDTFDHIFIVMDLGFQDIKKLLKSVPKTKITE